MEKNNVHVKHHLLLLFYEIKYIDIITLQNLLLLVTGSFE